LISWGSFNSMLSIYVWEVPLVHILRRLGTTAGHVKHCLG